MGCRAACVLAVLLAGLVPLGQGQEREKSVVPPLCCPGWAMLPALGARRAAGYGPEVKCYDSVRGTIYDYGALTIDGDEYIPFRKYEGKMVLFVNVATMDLPVPAGPDALPKHILDIWVIVLIILATILVMTALVLCPATAVIIYRVKCYDSVRGTIYDYGALTIDGDEYIPFRKYEGKMVLFVNVATYVRPGGGFVPNFQLFQKGDVNGAKEQKVYSFLKNSCPPVAEEFGNPKNLFWEPLRNHDIKWNFEKFLVGTDGVPVMRWYHRANIATVKNDIIAYMRQQRGQ
ncbi:UNVERIFIED_CONTAM: hypothetical protein H355_016754 [Colinus virginianus]|nr:hypothetical protein H355_016754 [Colinus virginianus]